MLETRSRVLGQGTHGRLMRCSWPAPRPCLLPIRSPPRPRRPLPLLQDVRVEGFPGLSTPSPRPCLQFETPALLRSQVTPGDLVSKDAEGQGRKPKVLSESWPEIWTSAWRSRSLSNHPPQPAASRPGLSASRAARPRPGCTWGWCLDFPVGFRFTCVGSARSAEQRHQEGPQRPSPTALLVK